MPYLWIFLILHSAYLTNILHQNHDLEDAECESNPITTKWYIGDYCYCFVSDGSCMKNVVDLEGKTFSRIHFDIIDDCETDENSKKPNKPKSLSECSGGQIYKADEIFDTLGIENEISEGDVAILFAEKECGQKGAIVEVIIEHNKLEYKEICNRTEYYSCENGHYGSKITYCKHRIEKEPEETIDESKVFTRGVDDLVDGTLLTIMVLVVVVLVISFVLFFALVMCIVLVIRSLQRSPHVPIHKPRSHFHGRRKSATTFYITPTSSPTISPSSSSGSIEDMVDFSSNSSTSVNISLSSSSSSGSD